MSFGLQNEIATEVKHPDERHIVGVSGITHAVHHGGGPDEGNNVGISGDGISEARKARGRSDASKRMAFFHKGISLIRLAVLSYQRKAKQED